MASEPTGLARYIAEASDSVGKSVARDPVLQGLANAIVTNPVGQFVGQSLQNYVGNNSPLDIAGDALSTGAVAAAMAYPPTGIPLGLARFMSPRVGAGVYQLGKEFLEDRLANILASEAANVGLAADDANNIRKALLRR